MFENIIMEKDTHTYLVDGIKYNSVSSYLKAIKVPFDSKMASLGKAKKLSKGDKDIVDDIRTSLLEEWDVNSNLSRYNGSLLHNYIERFLMFKIKSDNYFLQNELKQFDIFYETYMVNKNYESEFMVYDKQHRIAGTIDCFIEEYDGFTFIDWKTGNNEFDKSYNKLKVLDVKDSKLNLYSLQLSFYKYIFEKNTDYKVKKMIIVYFNKFSEDYEIINCIDYSDRISSIIDYVKEIKCLKV